MSRRELSFGTFILKVAVISLIALNLKQVWQWIQCQSIRNWSSCLSSKDMNGAPTGYGCLKSSP